MHDRNTPAERSASTTTPPIEPDLPVFADDGTDLTVIRWMLDKTPEERLRWLQAHMQAVMKVRRARTDP